jgi:hypothetical protein
VLVAVGVGDELARRVEVALAERRVLEQLAVPVAVAVGRLDLAGREERQPGLRAAVEVEAVRRAARDDDVVELPEGQRAERRLQGARALLDVEDLVALARAEDALLLLGRLADAQLDVAVVHQDLAAGDGVALGLDRPGVGEPVHVRVGHPLLEHRAA